MRYTVRPSDTLSGIAQQFGTTWQELLKLNPGIEDPNLIRVGQVVEVSDGPASAGDPASAPQGDVYGSYPGDTANKPAIARWMGDCAEAWSLPPELPVMASLTEISYAWDPGNRNIRDAWGYLVAVDHDSLGLFQQRPRWWGCKREGQTNCTWEQRQKHIMDPPHALSEFLDAALDVKGQRVQDPDGNRHHCMNGDEGAYGMWCQAIQRSFDSYGNNYQSNLDRAKRLLSSPEAPRADRPPGSADPGTTGAAQTWQTNGWIEILVDNRLGYVRAGSEGSQSWRTKGWIEIDTVGQLRFRPPEQG